MEAQLEIERRDKEHQEEINQMILKKLKPDGLINSDEKAYRGMDRDFEKSSDVIPVTLKRIRHRLQAQRWQTPKSLM